MAHLSLAKRRKLFKLPLFTRPKPSKPPSVSDYCSEPSTSGCSTAAADARKRGVRLADSDSDTDSSDRDSGPPARQSMFPEKLLKRRRYLEYEMLCKGRQMVFAFVNLTSVEEEMLRRLINSFASSFDVCLKQEWDDTVTHLIVDTVDNNICEYRSTIYMHALLSNCYIISTGWVEECLNSGYLVPELDYMVNDKYGEQTPLISWWSGRGVVKSPMEWTENCILYFYDFNATDETYVNTISWTKKAGFVIAQHIAELLDEKFRFRFVITGLSKNKLPTSETLMNIWIYKFKAATVHVKWLFECLYSYKFVPVDKRYQVLKLDQEMIENHLNMVGYV